MNWLDAVRSGTRADQPAASTLGDGTLYRVTDEDNIVEIVDGGAWDAFGSDGSGSVDDTAYDATSWDGVTDVAPSKNAVRDKFESIGGGLVSDTAYDESTWNGVTTVAPSKNAVRDKFEGLPAALISDTAYDATSWDGVTAIAPSKNAVRDKFEALPAALVSDTAYDATSWDGVTTVAPSKNAVRDKVESLASAITAAVDDTAYDATSWNGDTTHAPSKNAVRDKIESMGSSVSDAAYGAGWNGDTTTAPSKNAVYDKIESLGAAGAGAILAITQYSPGSLTVLSTTSTTPVAADATNLQITFTAPASGNIVARMQAFADISSGGQFYCWAWYTNAGTLFGRQGSITTSLANSGASVVVYEQIITGLTPGNSYTWEWRHWVPAGSFTGRILMDASGGGYPHALMTIISAP